MSLRNFALRSSLLLSLLLCGVCVCWSPKHSFLSMLSTAAADKRIANHFHRWTRWPPQPVSTKFPNHMYEGMLPPPSQLSSCNAIIFFFSNSQTQTRLWFTTQCTAMTPPPPLALSLFYYYSRSLSLQSVFIIYSLYYIIYIFSIEWIVNWNTFEIPTFLFLALSLPCNNNKVNLYL